MFSMLRRCQPEQNLRLQKFNYSFASMKLPVDLFASLIDLLSFSNTLVIINNSCELCGESLPIKKEEITST